MSGFDGRFVGRVSALLPTGWFAKESITLLHPDGQANIIVSSEPLDPSVDTARYAELQGSLLAREFPHYRQLWLIESRVFGRYDGVVRQFEWVPPDGRRVRQVQVYLVHAGRGYTATATAPIEAFDDVEFTIRRVLGDLRLIDVESVQFEDSI